MEGRHIENRTLGELSAMHDTLAYARQRIEARTGHSDTEALRLIVSVLMSIVDGTPFYRTPEVHDSVAYKPRRK